MSLEGEAKLSATFLGEVDDPKALGIQKKP